MRAIDTRAYRRTARERTRTLRVLTAAILSVVICGASVWATDMTIAVSPQMTIQPEQARGPAFLRDEQGLLVIVDYVQGYVLGRFLVPPGPNPLSGLPGSFSLGGGESAPARAREPRTDLRSQPGFPLDLESPVAGNPCITDIDRDGSAEIIVATLAGFVHVIGSSGRALPGWPVTVDDEFFAPPAAADIDADGRDEIVIGGTSGWVYAWHVDASSVSGWPVSPAVVSANTPITLREPAGGVFGAAALADIDRDGAAEVCVASAAGIVRLLEGDGSPVSGWPQMIAAAIVPQNTPGIYSAPAIGDIDGDSRFEIVVATNAYRVHAWRADGRVVPGWPVQVVNRARAGYSGVVLADLEGDGAVEVLTASEHGFLGPATVAAYHPDGGLVENWPYTLRESVYASLAVADLSGDGLPEIVVATIGGNASVVVLDGRSARPLPGWPVRLKNETVHASPILADVNGDGRTEIIIAALSTEARSQSWIWALDLAGTQLPGFPILFPEEEIVRGAPAVGNIDGDQNAEMVVATEMQHRLYAWDLAGSASAQASPWPMTAASPARTGRAPYETALASGRARSAAEPLVTVHFTLMMETDLQLAIFNVRGRRVRSLLDACLPPGEYAIRWDGRNDEGRALPSGIYFYRLVRDGQATTQQLLLMM